MTVIPDRQDRQVPDPIRVQVAPVGRVGEMQPQVHAFGWSVLALPERIIMDRTEWMPHLRVLMAQMELTEYPHMPEAFLFPETVSMAMMEYTVAGVVVLADVVRMEAHFSEIMDPDQVVAEVVKVDRPVRVQQADPVEEAPSDFTSPTMERVVYSMIVFLIQVFRALEVSVVFPVVWADRAVLAAGADRAVVLPDRVVTEVPVAMVEMEEMALPGSVSRCMKNQQGSRRYRPVWRPT